MTDQKKLPSDIEENIQNLAGDIYLQIEDKITALLTSYSGNVEITPEIITAHPLFLALKKQQETQQQQATDSEKKSSAELIRLKEEKENQQVKLSQLQEDLRNVEKLNSVTSTDSEKILKDKLAENSRLTKQVTALTQKNFKNQNLLKDTEVEITKVNKELKLLKKENQALEKNDKAKAATLAVQNQQHSELQLKFERISGELEQLKAEQDSKALANKKTFSEEQKQLSDKVITLEKSLENKTVSLQEQQDKLTSTISENKGLAEKVTNLQQKNQQQEKQLSLLEERVHSEHIQHQKFLDKKDELAQQTETKHQQALAEKDSALKDLQQKVDKTSTDLTQQTEKHAEQLTTESNKLAELQQVHDKALANAEQAEKTLSEKQQQLDVVQAELEADKAATLKNQQMHQENKDKQEREYNKARETIKYLRDENSELSQKLEQQVSELEDKITEYRLRFEYAQKQLTKMSQ
ncbi:MAG: hypothetical protein ACPG52_12530 [Cognaticolwellia sp.]